MELFKSVTNDMLRKIAVENTTFIASPQGIRYMGFDNILKILVKFWDGDRLDVCIFCNSEASCCFINEEAIKKEIIKFECLPDNGSKIKIFNNPIIICDNMNKNSMLIVDFNKNEIEAVFAI